MEHGGLADAVLRAAIYVSMAGGGADESVFAALKAIGATLPKHLRMGLEPFKAAMRKQYDAALDGAAPSPPCPS
jgi:tellurite resistance protein